MPKFISVDNTLFKDASEILDEVGINVDTAIKMTLKRIIREKGISFITASSEANISAMPLPTQVTTVIADNKMTKNRAVLLFNAQGINFNRNITFASKNRAAYNYWANPSFYALDTDWFLILNDWIKKELHLFKIPARTIRYNQLLCRVDQRDKIDLQINYNDPTYTDSRSKYSFSKYLVKTITY